MSHTFSLFVVASVAASFPTQATADCNALLDALQKADAHDRLAQYEVERADAPLPSNPALVRIGKTEYVAMSVGGRVSHYERHDSPAGGNPIGALRRGAKDGNAKCQSAGSGTVHGSAADKIRVEGKALPQMTVWIDKRSGLPLYHEVPALGIGYAWAFGDAVKEPKAGR